MLLTNKKLHVFTARQLPFRALRVLSYGLKFVPTLCRPDKEAFDEDVNRFFSSVRRRALFGNVDCIDPEKQFRIRNPIRYTDNVAVEQFCKSAARSLNKAWDALQASNPWYYCNTIMGDLQALSELANDPSFFISATDKNLGIGIFDTDVIFGLMRIHLSCGSYRRLKGFDHACAFRDEAIRLLRSLRPHFENQIFEFFSQNFEIAKFPKAYPLPKIHKLVLAIRPICPSFLSVVHHASIWVAFYLNRVVCTLPSICTGTKSLVQALEALNLDTADPNIRFITADVDSLYPSIDTDRGLATVRYVLEKFSSLAPAFICLLMQVLEVILRFNIFDFDGQFYLQTSGTAMGTPTAPPYANLFLFGLESAFFIGHAGIIFFKRYIDDLLFVTTSITTEYVINTLNNLCPGLSFTFSISEYQAVFLDLVISKGTRFFAEGKFDLCNFQKAINSYFYIPWFSAHPLHLKKGFIKGELMRYVRNCSSFAPYLVMRNQFYHRLRTRGYPRAFLVSSFKEVNYDMRRKLLAPSPPRADAVPPLFIRMPFSPFTTALDARKIVMSWWGLVDNLTPSLRDKPIFISGKGSTVQDLVRFSRKKS